MGLLRVYKSFPVQSFDEATGRVKAVISTFDIIDRDGDVITHKAFASNDHKTVAMVAAHDWSMSGWIGKGEIIVYPDRAEFDGQFFMDTHDGAEAFKKVRAMGDIQEWSHGFDITDARHGSKDGEAVRFIDGLEEYEVSPVLVGANQRTGTLDIKGEKATWDTSWAVIEVEIDHLEKAPARMTQEHRDRMHAAMTHMTAVHKAVCTMSENCPMQDGEGADAGEMKALIRESLRLKGADMNKLGKIAQRIDAASDALLAELGIADDDSKAFDVSAVLAEADHALFNTRGR